MVLTLLTFELPYKLTSSSTSSYHAPLTGGDGQTCCLSCRNLPAQSTPTASHLPFLPFTVWCFSPVSRASEFIREIAQVGWVSKHCEELSWVGRVVMIIRSHLKSEDHCPLDWSSWLILMILFTYVLLITCGISLRARQLYSQCRSVFKTNWHCILYYPDPSKRPKFRWYAIAVLFENASTLASTGFDASLHK